MLLSAPLLSTAIHGRADAQGESLGAFVRGGGPRRLEGRARTVSLFPGARTADVRDRYATSVSERLVARRRRHGVRDDRHDRPRAAHARACGPVPVRPRPERDQHRADRREEDGQGAPSLGPRGVHPGVPQGDRGDRQRPARAGGPRRHVGGLRAHVLHGFQRVPRVQPVDLPRAVAERALLPRRAPDILVSRLRDSARGSRHRLRGATLEPRVDEVPAHVERGDPDRDDATGPLNALKVAAAGAKAIEPLRAGSFLEKVEPIQHQTPICSRTLNPIEFLSSDAWYLKQLEFRDDLRRLAQEMEFRPTRHRQLVLDWIDSLTIDWPISRLRYYHTEIPLWYCKKCGETLAPPPGKYYRPWKDPAPFAKCPKCSSKEFVGEQR